MAKKINRTFTLSPELLQLVENLAREEGRSMSNMVEQLLAKAVREKCKPPLKMAIEQLKKGGRP